MTTPITTTSTKVAVTTTVKPIETKPLAINTTTTTTTVTTTTIAQTTEQLRNFTDSLLNTTTVGKISTVDPQNQDSTYLILAIVLSVVFCVAIILIVCFVTYRRGLKSRRRAQEEAQKAFQARVTPKNARVDEVKYEGSGFSQSGSRYSGTNQSEEDKKDEKDRFVDTRPQNEYIRPNEHKIGSIGDQTYQNTETANGALSSEPQYVNFTANTGVNDDDLYIDLANDNNQSGPKSPITNQSPNARTSMAGKTDQSQDGISQKERDSTYENLQSPGPDDYQKIDNKDPVHEAIYQNTMQTENNGGLYEEASKTDDIYVDMA